MPAVETRGLGKKFRLRRTGPGMRGILSPEIVQVEAVRDLDLRVEAGEILAFLGPNGAGKSTTIKMLTGILHPDAGEAAVLGLVPWKDRTRLAFRIGSVFGQKSQLWFHLPPSHSFELLAAIYEVEKGAFKRRQSELIDRFRLAPFWDTPVRKLSLGQRVRCEIAASFLHDPEILFLDEPTIGLDVVVKQEIRTLLLESNRERGTTIFLTSHDIGDIEKLCKRAVIIHHGGILLDQPLRELKHGALAKKHISVKYGAPADFSRIALAPLKIKTDQTAARFEVDTKTQSLQKLISSLSALGEISDLKVEDEPLENIIAEYFQADAGVRP